jgi:Golgi phosphoprotein 3 (GPP34)
MLIVEDLLLLLTDDTSGKPRVGSTELDLSLAGAVLIELAMAGKVDITGPDDPGRAGRLVVRDPAPTGDSLLDEALVRLSANPGRKPGRGLDLIKKDLRAATYRRLVERGIVRTENSKILGIFPTHRWPAQDVVHETGIRRALHEALVVGTTPQPQTAALVSLLQAIKAVNKVLDVPREDRSTVKQRAKQISQHAWAADAVRKAVDAVNSAVVAAVVAGSVAASAGSAG